MTEWSLARQRALSKAVDVLDDKWIVAVLTTLASAELPRMDILTTINNEQVADCPGERVELPRRALDNTLERAVKHGLIEPTTRKDTLGLVRYRLTIKGRSLLHALGPIVDWTREYRAPRQSNNNGN